MIPKKTAVKISAYYLILFGLVVSGAERGGNRGKCPGAHTVWGPTPSCVWPSFFFFRNIYHGPLAKGPKQNFCPEAQKSSQRPCW